MVKSENQTEMHIIRCWTVSSVSGAPAYSLERKLQPSLQPKINKLDYLMIIHKLSDCLNI